MSHSVLKADEDNLKRSNQSSLGSGLGFRPIRKRGYYRALNRRACWAVHHHAMKTMMNTLCADLYCPHNMAYLIFGLKGIVCG